MITDILERDFRELKGLEIPGKLVLDFDEREEIPRQAFLESSGKKVGIAELEKGPFYCNGRLYVEYIISSLNF